MSGNNVAFNDDGYSYKCVYRNGLHFGDIEMLEDSYWYFFMKAGNFGGIDYRTMREIADKLEELNS